MHPPYRAGPASKKKNYMLFMFQIYKNACEFSECSRNSLENLYFLK